MKKRRRIESRLFALSICLSMCGALFAAGLLPSFRTVSSSARAHASESAAVEPALTAGLAPQSSGHSLSLIRAANQRVSVLSSASLNITGALTVEAWIKTASGNTGQSIVSRYNDNAQSGNDGGYQLRLVNAGGSNKLRMVVYTNNVSQTSITGSTAIGVNTWYHVAGVYSGGQLWLFVNGQPDGTPKSAPTPPAAGTANLRIGRSSDGNDHFDGKIDEVRVSAQALYPANIQFNPQAHLTATSGVTRGLWKFDGQTANDSSGNNNHGELQNGASFSTDVPISNQHPTANAGGPYTGTRGVPVQFNGSGSFDPDGQIVSYNWNFGDTATGTGVMPTHAYANAGNYTASLVVTDNLGLQSIASTAQVTINDGPPPPNQPPLVTITSPANGAAFNAPANIAITATASDSDGSVTRVDFFGDGAFIGMSTGPPYTVSWNGVSAGTHTIRATATDNQGATSSHQISVTVNSGGGGTSASFIRTDAATQGNWRNTYGADGFNIAGDSPVSYPAYAQVSVNGHALHTWAASTYEFRALQKIASTNDRIAATMYAVTSFTINVNLTDGQPHHLALYCLDWDDTGLRQQRIDVRNAVNDALLDTQTVTDFRNGKYLVWRVTGNIKIVLTNLSGWNAVVSGIFFDPTTAPTPPSGTNLALGRPATQSSNANIANPNPGTADRATDGIVYGDYFAGDSVTHTNPELQPWWQVDLGSSQSINSVRLWNRTDCCGERLNNFYLFVSDNPFTSNTISGIQAQPGVDTYRPAGPVGILTAINVNRMGRYIRVQLSNATGVALSLAEVQVLGTQPAAPVPAGTNLALNRPATQSSTAFNGPPNLAVDGNTSGVFTDGSITCTDWNFQAWWQVDLGNVQTINTIRLWNRTDCCADRTSYFYVSVSDSPLPSDLKTTLGQPGVSNYFLTYVQGNPTSYRINRTGRYMRVQLRGTNFLSIAELQVWGTASSSNQPPTANAGGPYNGVVGTAVVFNGNGSFDPDGQIVSYNWSFGDNTTGTGVSPAHVYTAPGTYTVTLTVTDNGGLQSSASNTTANIDSAPPPPSGNQLTKEYVYAGGRLIAVEEPVSGNAPSGGLPSMVGMYRSGAYYLDTGNNRWDKPSADREHFFGAGDLPVVGNWVGSADFEIGAFRVVDTTAYFFLDLNGNGVWDEGVDGQSQFGIPGDIPVAGDWDGNGAYEIGIYRKVDGEGWWYLDLNGSRAWDQGDRAYQFGLGTDLPVVGDWNGSGKFKLGVFRDGNWYLDYNGNGSWDGAQGGDRVDWFGQQGDIPVAGEWDGGGPSKIGVFRNAGGAGYWYLDTNGSNAWEEGKDRSIQFGYGADKPIPGKWQRPEATQISRRTSRRTRSFPGVVLKGGRQ
ncbi:MAG TPA: PKD domain-containing protein [Blastocatellia bacterium]|nr:PKD domain-containing protein [Blastocatellia bacterium]